NPLGATSQVEGGIIQAIGHTLSEECLLDPQSGITLTQTLDSYKLPTIADLPEIVCEFVDKPDEHRLEGPRRATHHPDRRGDRERDPGRDGRRSARAADHAGGNAARAARGRGAPAGAGASWSYSGLTQPRPLLRRSATARSRSRAGRRCCRCSAT